MLNMRFRKSYPAYWRKYQAKLKRSARLKRFGKKLALVSVILGLVIAGFSFFYFTESTLSGNSNQPGKKSLSPEIKTSLWPEKLSRQDISDYLKQRTHTSAGGIGQFALEKDGTRFWVETTLDSDLQKYIDRMLRYSRTLQAAVVVLDPFDGRILAMASRDTNGNGDNLCLKAEFPAASLIKIISTAAVLEKAGYTLDQSLFYKGSKHTLYRFQLKESKGSHSARTNLRKAFATSNNSVFGKIGIYALGQEIIDEYAEKFYFNRPIPFDLPLAVSTIDVPDDTFGLAEIASGFNKRTLVSPLHAAMLSAVVANCGDMVVPWLVNKITDETLKIAYRAPRGVLISPISRKTAEDLKFLMKYTARYGTTRSAFRELRQQKSMADLDLGAKTGTINDRLDRYKYDWITAFALTAEGTRGICIGVLAVHGEKLGTRSTELVRAIIDYYYRS
jgi:cell division protein FtsI/penicillin-binding protein 2